MRKTICLMMATAALAGGISRAVTEKEQDISVIAKGNCEFAFDLYDKLKEKGGNLFFSPYSISTALAMTYAGAEGDTEKQMAATLRFTTSIPEERFHHLFGQLGKILNQQGQRGDYQLSVANALWLHRDYPFLPGYLKQVQTGYDAAFEQLDFVKEIEESRQKINQWVEDKTNQKIKELLKKGVLNEQTRLVLTNAIYFKGDWALQFPKDNTKPMPFYAETDKKVDVPMMYQKGKFRFADCGEVLMLELPYKGESLSMLILLPKEMDGIASLEKEIDTEQISLWEKKLFEKEVMVYLPRFKMTGEFALAGTLKEMGMPDAFSGAADFSGMSQSRELFIQAVIHKAFVEVNEEGTEAAAATGVVVGVTAMPAAPPIFRADHPFVFMIKDNATNSILFIGRVADPTKTGE